MNLIQLGNWTKMSGSVAVYENGKVRFEPTEVTYRTISYYYNQAIEKLSNTAAKSKASPARSISAPQVESPSNTKVVPTPPVETAGDSKVATRSVPTKSTVAEKVAEAVKETPSEPASVIPAPTEAVNAVANDAAVTKEVSTSTTPTSASVVKVEEGVLRSAAIDLPQPEYPDAALLARAGGTVEVQVLVSEKGLVSNARAQSGNPLLIQAAESAALKARFSPTKISTKPTIAFGVLTYHFTPPEAPKAALTSNSMAERMPSLAEEKKVTQAQAENAAFVASRPATVSETKPKVNSESGLSPYDQGVALLAVGDYPKAAEMLNRAIQANPNDPNPYVKLAMSYSRMNKNKEAIATYKMAAQINAGAVDAVAYHSWGRSYLALEKNTEAISAFKQALTRMRDETVATEPKTSGMPSLAQVHFDLGTAYINSRRFGDSIKEFKQVVALSPANAEAHYALAIAYISNNNRRAAEDVNKILATLNPTLSQKVGFALVAPESRHGCRNIGCR